MDYSHRMCNIIELRLWKQTYLLEFARSESHSLVKIKLHKSGLFLCTCTKQTLWSCILKNNNSVIGTVLVHTRIWLNKLEVQCSVWEVSVIKLFQETHEDFTKLCSCNVCRQTGCCSITKGITNNSKRGGNLVKYSTWNNILRIHVFCGHSTFFMQWIVAKSSNC